MQYQIHTDGAEDTEGKIIPRAGAYITIPISDTKMALLLKSEEGILRRLVVDIPKEEPKQKLPRKKKTTPTS